MALPENIRDFLYLIREGRVDNSYKMVWAKAIVDLCTERPERTDIPLTQVAKKVFGYYWNIHVFFDPDGNTLMQGSNIKKPPKILQLVLKSICEYKELKSQTFKPVFYERINTVDLAKLDVNYAAVTSFLKTDVRHRFLKLGDQELSLYDYETDAEQLRFKKGECKTIAMYQDVLHEAILFRWTQIIEDFNSSTPRIASKLRIRRDAPPKRASLSRFCEWLLLENPNKLCSICGENIQTDKETSVDHLIPWSFLYSDDIWNVAFAHKSCNSSKNNRCPKKLDILKQQERNFALYELLKENPEKKNKKEFKELEMANSQNYLEKMWRLYVS